MELHRNEAIEINREMKPKTVSLAMYAWVIGTLWPPFLTVLSEVIGHENFRATFDVTLLGMLGTTVFASIVAVGAAMQLKYKLRVRILLAIPAGIMLAYFGWMTFIVLLSKLLLAW